MRRRNILWALLILAGVAATACIGGTDGKNHCKTNDDCHENYLCDASDTKVCLRKCTAATEAADCLSAQSCDVPAGDTDGFCREKSSSGGDPAAGDPGAGDPSSGD